MKKNQENTESSKASPFGGGLEGASIEYTLYLADNALILGHRNSEWCGHGPILEQDIAITNISLDLIGQARNFYQYAAKLIGDNASEDTLAYLRDAHEFKNCLLMEQPNGDWAQTITRQFFFSVYQFYLYEQLQENKDAQLAAIAVKSLKEVTYHLRWSSEWIIRLGDGTEESHERMLAAVETLWPYTEELFTPALYENDLRVDLISVKDKWTKKVKEIFLEATLSYPVGGPMHKGGKTGKHTVQLDNILEELQFMQRAYPNSEW
jgi:ring-1,2-phenylacetyl-CoA epoxidase subunit PaaC